MPAPPKARTHLIAEIRPDQRRWLRSVAITNNVSAASLIRSLLDQAMADADLLATCVQDARVHVSPA